VCGSGDIAPRINSALNGAECQLHPPTGRFAPRVRAPFTHWIGGWVGSQSRSGRGGGPSFSLPGVQHRSSSPFHSIYTDQALQTPHIHWLYMKMFHSIYYWNHVRIFQNVRMDTATEQRIFQVFFLFPSSFSSPSFLLFISSMFPINPLNYYAHILSTIGLNSFPFPGKHIMEKEMWKIKHAVLFCSTRSYEERKAVPQIKLPPPIQHDPQPVSSTSHPHNLFP
jgi:hypothetical protein